MSAALEFQAVSVLNAEGRLLLEAVSLAIEAGSTMVLLGRSGSGKTTLLRTVNRLVVPARGEVLVNGVPNSGANLIGLRRGIGYVIQETGLFPHFTVERNVGIVLESEGLPRAPRIEKSRELLAAVGLDPRIYALRLPHQLSGGQRQRVGLARALAADPAILLMDEPFGALDPLTRGEMQDMLRALLSRLKKTALLVTHDLNEALYLGDRVALLHQGKMVAALTPRQFLASDRPEIKTYIEAFQRGEQVARQ